MVEDGSKDHGVFGVCLGFFLPSQVLGAQSLKLSTKQLDLLQLRNEFEFLMLDYFFLFCVCVCVFLFHFIIIPF